MAPEKITTIRLQKKRDSQEKIVALTAYDVAFARLLDGLVDVVLVGDSLGMVVQGERTTLSVTIDQMAYHTKIVGRGLKSALLVADMPFLTYHANLEATMRNAAKLMQEGGAESVKLEGGAEIAPTIERLVQSGVPVMGHLGMTPQHVHRMGGFTVQARETEARRRLVEDALALERAGAYAIVLEAIPADLAAEVTDRLHVPTIGIGAGKNCSGQILVVHDLLGMEEGIRRPKFVKVFAPIGEAIRAAVGDYAAAVRAGTFPGEEHEYR